MVFDRCAVVGETLERIVELPILRSIGARFPVRYIQAVTEAGFKVTRVLRTLVDSSQMDNSLPLVICWRMDECMKQI